MLDEQTPSQTDENSSTENAGESPSAPETEAAPAPRKRTRKTAAKKAVAAETTEAADATAQDESPAPAKKTAPRKRTAKKAAAPAEPAPAEAGAPTDSGAAPTDAPAEVPADGPDGAPAKRTAAKRTRTRKTAEPVEAAAAAAEAAAPADSEPGEDRSAAVPLFQAPPEAPAKKAAAKRTRKTAARKKVEETPDATLESPTEDEDAEETPTEGIAAEPDAAGESGQDDSDQDDEDSAGESDSDGDGQPRRRRRRGGRRRRRGGSGSGSGGDSDSSDDADSSDDTDGSEDSDADDSEDSGTAESAGSDNGEGGGSSSSRRRRRRRRSSDSDAEVSDDPENTVTRVRKGRSAEDEITGFTGSTRLEAKKQRRREGREAGRRRAPIISEAEFLARRESVDRKMVIRQRGDLTQIAVLEDKVLVEHYVARESQTSLIGNVYLGRVQNVLPSMEAAFIDIGKGRNAVLYAGEVNWDALGAKDGSQRKIEQVLKSGQSVLVQVTKDPIGHKGARLTSQVSLPGRFLVYVPDGTTSGISRKLPDKERTRLKTLLKEIVPEDAGVIVRTAAEGAEEKELVRDVERLKALWEDISGKVEKGNAPQLLYGEPDLTLKVVRDLFTEDIDKLVVSGDEAWDMVDSYVRHIAPDLVDRLERHDDGESDAFAAYRIDEQIAKALDRKVWLPSGGSLVIDRTEAMTVVDVNTGKFTGSGGNLEETVTKNNLEAAEEIVRQLRLRDIGGIIVVDFIDMVLESNRDLVLRRLVECLGRDRTRHQVAEVTSLGLVQMTRKRIGTGLLEAFSESCEHCQGRGLITHHEPVEPKKRQQSDDEPRRGRGRGRGRGRSDDQANDTDDSNGGAERGHDKKGGSEQSAPEVKRPTPAEFAAMARAEAAERRAEEPSAGEPSTEKPAETPAADASPEAPAETPEPAEATAPAETSAPAEEPAPVETPPEPAAPRIVTSVRRVGARRAAGPPREAAAGTGSDSPSDTGGGSGDEGSDAESVPSPVESANEPAQVHVPVKKKGSRR